MTVFPRAAMPAPFRLALLACALGAMTAQVQAADKAATAATPTAASSVELAAQINLSEGKSTLMHLPYPVARLAVGDAKVADVILINPSEVYMLGKSTGSTNLILWNKAKQATIIDIVVGLETVSLRQQFDLLFPNEKDIRVTVSGSTLILSGTVADSVRAAQVVSVANAYLQRNGRSGGNAAPAASAAPASAADTGTGSTASASAAPAAAAGQGSGGRVINMLAVAAPQQVMLEVKIAEI